MLKLFRRPAQVYPLQLLHSYWSPVFDRFAEAVLIVDQYLNIYKSNITWQHFSQSDMQDLSLSLYPEDVHKLKSLLSSPQLTESCRIRLRDAQQNLRWFELSANYLVSQPETQQYYWCLLLSDQTEKIKQQYRQSAQQRSLNDLIKRLPMMLYRSRNDFNWTMEYLSDGCVDVTGYAPTELLNTPRFGQMIHPDDAPYVWSSVQDALNQKGIFDVIYRILLDGKQVVWVQDIGWGVYSESDMILAVEGVIWRTAEQMPEPIVDSISLKK
ncbi:PAS domain-containing protein [Acinetobacter brisouii]|uniref:PAS domain-containing protein n=1 Tax=Acinetobacter brisouii TaxID=396323 RepID=UPI00124EB0E8|nr:PAS domain-containing protein [Acinetobacter brisouii]